MQLKTNPVSSKVENYNLGPPHYRSSALSSWPVPLKDSATLPTPWVFPDGVHLHKNVPVIFRFIFNLKLLCCGTWHGGCFGPKIHYHCKFTVVNNNNASLNEEKNDLLSKNHFRKGSLILVCTKFFQYNRVKTNYGILDFNRGLTLYLP